MAFWLVLLIVSSAIAIFSSYKWNEERRGQNRPRVLRNYGPSAIGLAVMSLIILLRIVLH